MASSPTSTPGIPGYKATPWVDNNELSNSSKTASVASMSNLLHDQAPPRPPFMRNARNSARLANGYTDSWRSSEYSDSRYGGGSKARILSFASTDSEKLTFSLDPNVWVADLSLNLVEDDDDDLHDPSAKPNMKKERLSSVSSRGVVNVGCLGLLFVILIGLFALYPIVVTVTRSKLSNLGGFNLGGINASGQVPALGWGLIDLDTPQSAYTVPSWQDGSDLELVFSDEFNTDGRTFYPGDDPYWEAVDLHYWGTNDLEWYDPAAITTGGGNLQITISKQSTHGLNYQGGMMSTWNKFCFTGGYIETSVSIPGLNNIVGFWPAIWTMGNLGRAGYGATLEGMWPYTYDACDVGTAPNQTFNGQPVNATIDGDAGNGGVLSFLPGQRLSRCTCEGESHPGPKHSDGTFVGRAAPEIDVLEAQITGTPLTAQVSQSAQWAPFNFGYQWFNTSDNEVIIDPTISAQNTYIGGVQQQATSVVTSTDPDCYTNETGCFSVYGFEYQPGFDGAYITWIATNKIAWTLNQAGMDADPRVNISARPVPQEPMYIIMNLGMSRNFGAVDLDHLPFPSTMMVDYIRVYQPKDQKNIGCDPKDFPTADYINQYIEAYTNPNLTTWRNDFNQPFPKNSFLGQC